MIHVDEPIAVMAASALTIIGALAGALWQRGRAWRDRVPAREPNLEQIHARFDRLEQLGDAMAVELERVSEGQRFTTRLLAERAVAQAPAAVPLSRSPEYRTPH
jgi:hypothetical protein